MRKIIGVLLVLMLVLTACGSKETVKIEEESAEVKSEIKINQDFENGVSFTGSLTSNIAPYFLVLENDYNKVDINGKAYGRLAFEQDIISKYVDRSDFSYHLEGFPMIDGDYIDMTIEFDPETAYETRGYLMVKDYRVVPSYGVEPTDKSNEPYPTTYYQDVIKILCIGLFGANEEDIKSNEGVENKDFKEAVEIILDKGYQFVQSKSYYRVINENAYNIDHIPTLNEICEITGIKQSDLTRTVDGGYFVYSTSWSDDEIEFSIYHDEENLTGDEKVNYIGIKGYDYSLYGFGLGDTVLNIYAKLDKRYDGMYSHHSDSYAKYVYNVDGYAFVLNHIGFDDQAKMDEMDLVKSISFYELLD